MNILFRAILTGFGLRVGSEIAKAVAGKIKERFDPSDGEHGDESTDDEDDDGLPGTEPDPPDL